MKRLALLSLVGLALVIAGSASANHDPGQNLSPWFCPGTGGQHPGTFSSAVPLRVTYGWGALQQPQLDKFLKVQFGRVTVRNSSGAIIVDDAWNKGDTTGWSSYFATTLTPPGGGTSKSGWQTHKHTYLDGDPSTAGNQPLAPGTYTLDFQLGIDSVVQDGFSAVRPEDLPTITNCAFVVT